MVNENESAVGFIYTENYKEYDFGQGHPLTPLRIEVTYELMREYGLLDSDNIKLLKPRMATEEEVLRVHKKNYIELLKQLGELKDNYKYLSYPEFGLGPGDNPVFPNMYNASRLIAGASIVAADYLLNNEFHTRAHNILGGLHHAMPDSASGFCILNDVAIAIEHIKTKMPDTKIMYLDIDCHHGDGVQYIYYDRADVLTLSFHQDGRTLFPGTGFVEEMGRGKGEGYAINMPFPPLTTDHLYLPAFEKITSAVIKAYRPDMVVFQTGVDTHFMDPLTQLSLSTSGHEKIFKITLDLVSKYGSDKLLVLGGGGYNIGFVAVSWTLLLALLLGKEIEDPLPEKWLKFLKTKWTEEAPPSVLRDKYWYIEERLIKDPYSFDELESEIDKRVEYIFENIIPKIKEHPEF